MGLFILWWIFIGDPVKITQIQIRLWNRDYCWQQARLDPIKQAECDYEFKWHECVIYNEELGDIENELVIEQIFDLRFEQRLQSVQADIYESKD